MSNHQVEVIKMTNVACNLATHQAKSIEALCLNPQCKENATLCSKCLINSHRQCRKKLNDLEVIPNLLMELQELSFDILKLQEIINQHFKELLQKIEQFMCPISQYQNSPNLTNLNKIGFLLKKNPKLTLLQLIDGTKNQIRSLLDQRNQKQQKPEEIIYKVQQKQQETRKDSQESYQASRCKRKSKQIRKQVEYVQKEPTKNAQNWFQEGKSLFLQEKYNEAITCFDQAIKIDVNHCESWYYKGKLLHNQNKDNEAISCFDKAIKLKSKNHLY